MTQPRTAIYTALGLDGYELCHPVDHDDFESIVLLINGRPRLARWRPLSMRLIREDEGQKLVRSDAPWLGYDSTLIFRPTVILALGPLLREHGELLPLRCDDAELWMFNPWLLNALDERASTIERFGTARIISIPRLVFRPDIIRGVHAFKIPQLRASPVYLSQHFVNAWHSAGLKGLEFTPEWTEP